MLLHQVALPPCVYAFVCFFFFEMEIIVTQESGNLSSYS